MFLEKNKLQILFFYFSAKTNRNFVIDYINIMAHFCRFFFFFGLDWHSARIIEFKVKFTLHKHV